MFAAAPAVFVRLNVPEVAPVAEAATLYEPATVLAVNAVAMATPLEFVEAVVVFVPLANVPLAPLAGAVNVTDTFGTRFPSLSFTVACSKVANAVPTVAPCPDPAVAVIVAAAPGLLVRLKFADVAVPDVATTLYGPPAVLLAVKAVAIATPLAFVVAFVVFVPFANVPLLPLAGAVNVTVTFGTRFPWLSFTVACSRVAKAVPTVALCPDPAVAVIVAAEPALFVRRKWPGVAAPAVADTV